MLPAHFTEAWIHEVHTVLGRRLRPYCLWHRLALSVIESPFPDVTGQPSLADLEIAVRICASGFGAQSFLRQLGRSAGLLTRLRMAYLSARYQPARETTRFIAYVRDYQSLPLFWQQSGEGSSETSGAPPEEVSVVCRLMSAGVSEAAAWMMPIGAAYWYSATLARQAGSDIRFRSESAAFLSNIEELKAQYQAAKEARLARA